MAKEAALSGKYTAYPEYKDSELTWLGYVPFHWTVSKFGYVKTVLTDFTANGSFADLKNNVVYRDEPSHARLVRLTDLRADLENKNGVWIDKDAYEYLGKSALFGGEFLLANVGAYAGLFYQMPENKGNASLAPNMFMAKFDGNKILREFMAYVGQSQSANEQLRLNATASSAQPKLNKDDFKSVRFTYPSIQEQQKIASFLDHETAKIDTLIDKQQQLIALLKEKRQAVISHAVTKGLNPNAPMRDSGVEWLGEVPAHWDTIPLKLVVSTRKGVAFKSADFCDTGIRVVKASDIKQKTIKATDVFLPVSFATDYPKALLNSGDIILSTVGSNPDVKNSAVGQIGMVPEALSDTLLNQNTVVIDPDVSKVLREYLFYILQMEGYRDHLDLHAHGTANQSSLSISDMLNFNICFPSVEEQREICSYLKLKQQKLSDLELHSTDSEKLLKERRTALISAAVTGKIDVRNWQAPATTNNKDVAA